MTRAEYAVSQLACPGGSCIHPSCVRVTCLFLLVLVGLASLPVAACSYHELPTARAGMLNWLYPDSLHVQAEIWRAQEAGELPYLESVQGLPGQGTPDLLSFRRAAAALKVLGNTFDRVGLGEHSESFSLVLVESVLWARFGHYEQHKRVEIDVSGPGVGDLVLVTGEPVLYAMANGSLPLSRAVKSGVLKLYGDQQQIDDLLAKYGDVGG